MLYDAEAVFKNDLPTLSYANCQVPDSSGLKRPMHMHHDNCELLFCYEGEGFYRIDGSIYAVHKGDLILYNAGASHEIASSPGSRLGDFCFGYTDVHLAGLEKNTLLHQSESPIRQAGSRFSFFNELSEQIISHFDTVPLPTQNIRLMGAVLLLSALELESAPQRKVENESTIALVNKVKSYIDLHYMENITLDKLAAYSSYSASYISHAFREVMGYSPIEYVNRCRIGLAQNYLISNDYSVSYISSLCEFNNYGYFVSLFHKVVGVTPLQYRKMYLHDLKGKRNQL